MSEKNLTESDVVKFVKTKLGDSFREYQLKPHVYGKNRIFITIDKDANKNATKTMVTKFNARLITISGVDHGETLGIVYHFNLPTSGLVVNMKITDLPRDDPEVNSVSDILPAAIYMELEVHDLFGIKFKGNPLKRKWIIADDWPEGEFPLRKEYTYGE